MSKPLALRFRPQVFGDLVGNEIIRTILLNTIITGKIRNAYFFAGSRGSGKTTAARIFAKALNCTNPQEGEPCNKCVSCVSIHNERSVDVLEIDAASENSVQSIRDLSNSIQYLPTYSKHKVIILDEVHMLTQQASNALLKTLEEPPNHVVFIFCTTDPQKVIETIRSRTMMFQFQRLNPNSIVERLKYICDQEKLKYDEEALNLIAFSVNGGMRDAITLLDQSSIYRESITYDVVKDIVGFISYKDVSDFFSNLENKEYCLNWLRSFMIKNSSQEIINSFLRFLESLVFIQNSVEVDYLTPEIYSELKMLSSKIDIVKLSSCIASCYRTLKTQKSVQVYDGSIFIVDLYLSFLAIFLEKNVVQQLDVSLLSIFKGEKQVVEKSIKDIIKEQFTFTELKGILIR